MSLCRLARFAAPLFLAYTLNAATAVEIAQGFRNSAIIAKPKANLTSAEVIALERSAGILRAEGLSPISQARLLHLRPGDNPQSAIERLNATGLYEFVEPDYIRFRFATPNDPKYTEGATWHLANKGNEGGKSGSDIDAAAAWDIRTDASSVLVAVMDTGVRATHEDLKDNLWVNPDEIAGNGVDDDANGYIDDVYGANVIEGKTGAQKGNVADDHGHGTAVASVIGASGNNGKGTTGVAWKAKIMSLKWDDKEGSAFSSAGSRAIDYAIAKKAKIINVSYGGAYYSKEEFEALKRARDAGIIIVAAAGNDRTNTDVKPTFPAAHKLDNIIVAAASDRDDELANFSNYGASNTDVAAPGVDIVVADRASDTGYKLFDGTSFSAPIVTGSLALLKAQFPTDDYRATINRLLGTTEAVANYQGKIATGGRMNLAKALASTDSTPFNDRFASASLVQGAVVTIRASSKHATAETGAPVIAGVNNAAPLWWTWKAPASGTVVVDTIGSDFDTVAAVFTGTALNALTEVKSNDDAAAGTTTSRFEFSAVANTTYKVAVGGKAGVTGLASVTIGYIPDNNAFANAKVVTGTSVSGTNTNVLANREAGEPVLTTDTAGATVDGATVWYKWTAVGSRIWFNTKGHGIDTVVRAYTGNSVGALSAVADTYPTDSQVLFNPTPGTVYYFAVDSLNGKTGSFTFVISDASIIYDMYNEVNGAPAYDQQKQNLYYSNAGGLIGVLPLTDKYDENYVRVKGHLEFQSPVVNGKGEVYVADSAGFLTKFDSGLTKLWEKEQADTVYHASPAIAADGTVYVHSADNKVHAYRSDGTVRWTAALEKNEEDAAYGAVSISSNGRLYVPSGKKLFCLDPLNGQVLWSQETAGLLYASAAISEANIAYIPDDEGYLNAFSATGAVLWKKKIGFAASSSPALAPNGDIVYGDSNGKVYSVKTDGEVRWSYQTEDSIWFSSPAVDANGRTYIGSYDGFLHIVDSTGKLVKSFASGDEISSSPLVSNSLLVYGSKDNFITFRDGEGLLPSTAWPIFRGNTRRTGLVRSTGAPTFVTQPQSTGIVAGTKTTLAAQVSGADDMTFQWYKDGVAISGATHSDYVIESANAGNAGSYTVKVTNSAGSVTSTAAVLTLATADNRGYLSNMSVRSVVGTGSSTLTFGYTLGGAGTSGSTPVLVRASGPVLAGSPFNVPGVVADPTLKINRLGEAPAVLVENNDWDSADTALTGAIARTGAFPFGSSAKEAAVVQDTSSGGYTAEVGNKAGARGVSLVEVYDASTVHTAQAPRFTNASTRAEVGKDGDVLIMGFTIKGSTPVKLLIRGIGPRLSAFNVTGLLQDPTLELVNQANGQVIVSNDDWSANAVEKAAIEAASAGAFSLLGGGFPDDNKSAAMIVTLQPGGYTATVRGKNNTTGVALVELYELP